MEEARVIARFAKNAMEEVRVQTVNYRGYDLIDLRVWVLKEDGKDAVATRKGITINIGLLPELKKAVLALDEALKGK